MINAADTGCGAPMKRYLLLLCVVAVVLVARAQKASSAIKAPTPEERWLRPAQRLSASIDSDLWRLSPPQQAVARAQLASIWWNHDPTSARTWASAAVDWLTHTPENELDSDRAQRIRAARIALSLITPLDSALRQRIDDMLQPKDVPPGPQEATAAKNYYGTVLSAAMQDRSHPERLAQAISDSLPSGVTGVTVHALITLRSVQPDPADILFRRALLSAGDSPDALLSFAAALHPEPGATPLPDAWRVPSLEAIAHVLGGDTGEADQRMKLCRLYSRVSGYSDFPPDIAAAVAHGRSNCQLPQPNPDQVFDSNLFRERAPKTADDFLTLIPEVKTAQDRAQMRMNAATRAELDDKDPERALKIMDSMPPDELASRPGAYERMRMELATRAALHAIDAGRNDDAYRILDESPSISAFYISVNVLQKSRKPLSTKFYDLALKQMSGEETDNPMDYVNLMNLYFRKGDLSPLNAIVSEMDRWKAKDPKALKAGEAFYTAPWNWLTPLQLGREVADFDASAVSGHFANAQNVPLRIELQISLTRALISRYESMAPKEEPGR